MWVEILKNNYVLILFGFALVVFAFILLRNNVLYKDKTRLFSIGKNSVEQEEENNNFIKINPVDKASKYCNSIEIVKRYGDLKVSVQDKFTERLLSFYELLRKFEQKKVLFTIDLRETHFINKIAISGFYRLLYHCQENNHVQILILYEFGESPSVDDFIYHLEIWVKGFPELNAKIKHIGKKRHESRTT